MNPEVPKSIPHVFGDGRMPTERDVPFFVWNERSTRLWEWLQYTGPRPSAQPSSSARAEGTGSQHDAKAEPKSKATTNGQKQSEREESTSARHVFSKLVVSR